MKSARVSKAIEDFLNYIGSIQKLYLLNSESVNQLDKETQDLLHDLELGDFDYKERAKIATKLRKVRKDRRYFKDLAEEQSPLNDWCIKNKDSINQLKNVLGAIRKQEQYHENRSYNRKVKQ